MSEEVIAKESSGGNIPPHPEGQFAVKCIDLIDHGMVKTTWQGKERERHRIVLRYWGGQKAADGTPLWIDKWFTLSLSEKSALRPFLQAWRGQAFTPEELAGFNVAKLVGVKALIQVSHNRTPERTYANIDSIMRLPPNIEGPPDLAGYVRVKDRPKDEGGTPAGAHDDDDLPF